MRRSIICNHGEQNIVGGGNCSHEHLSTSGEMPILLGSTVARSNKTNEKAKVIKVNSAHGYGKAERYNDGNLSCCRLGPLFLSEDLSSINDKIDGGLDLDCGGIPELIVKPTAIEIDFRKKLNTIYEHGSDGAGDGDGHAGKKKCEELGFLIGSTEFPKCLRILTQ